MFTGFLMFDIHMYVCVYIYTYICITFKQLCMKLRNTKILCAEAKPNEEMNGKKGRNAVSSEKEAPMDLW